MRPVLDQRIVDAWLYGAPANVVYLLPAEVAERLCAQLRRMRVVIADVDPEAYMRWLETGEGPDPLEEALARTRWPVPIPSDRGPGPTVYDLRLERQEPESRLVEMLTTPSNWGAGPKLETP
jgi:hypothetical protein